MMTLSTRSGHFREYGRGAGISIPRNEGYANERRPFPRILRGERVNISMPLDANESHPFLGTGAPFSSRNRWLPALLPHRNSALLPHRNSALPFCLLLRARFVFKLPFCLQAAFRLWTRGGGGREVAFEKPFECASTQVACFENPQN